MSRRPLDGITTWVLLAVLLLAARPATAQPLSVSAHIGPADGLADPTVTAVLRDRTGFLWIGSIDRISRYDGYEIVSFQPPPDSAAPAGDYVNLQALVEDADGVLWIGGRTGLHRFDPRTQSFVSYRRDGSGPCSLPDDGVEALVVGRDGRLWVGTATGVRLFVQGPTPEDACFRALPGGEIGYTSTLFEDRKGVLWIGGWDGLFRFDPAAGRVARFTPSDPEASRLPDDAFVYDIVEDPSGRLWVGTSTHGLFWIDPRRAGVRRYTHDPADAGSLPADFVMALHADWAGRIWIGTYEDGLAVLDPETDRVTRYGVQPGDPDGLASPQITSFADGRAGGLWVGTWRGVHRLAPPSPFTVHDAAPDGPLPHTDVTALAPAPGDALWVGTFGGLGRFAPDTRRWTQVDGLESNRISSIWTAPDGALWVGTLGDGLDRLDPETGRFAAFRHRPGDPRPDVVYAMHGDHAGGLWTGTLGGGLQYLAPDAEHFTAYLPSPEASGDPRNSIFTLLEDHTGALWAGTAGGGLLRFDRATKTFTAFRHDPADPHSLSHNEVITLAETADGTLWIGTGDGLNRFDRDTERFERFNPDAPLPYQRVTCIVADARDALWIGTTGGLARFDPRHAHWTTYDADPALADVRLSYDACTRSPDGRLYFGSLNGLVGFDPAAVSAHAPPPPVVLTDLEIFNTSAPLDTAITHARRIELAHDQNFVAFEFAALDFSAPEHNAYAYRLEGVDPDWNHVGARRYAGYPNLPPGRYTFRVKAANPMGIWNEQGAAVHLRIRPPWWQTWWFTTLAALALAAVGIGLYHARRRALRKIETTRRRIADDLHDDIGSKMSSVALRIELAGRDPGLDAPQRDQLAALSDTVRRLAGDLRDTVWIVDAERDTLDHLLRRLRETAVQILPDHDVCFDQVTSLPEVALDMEQRRQLFLLVKEAFHNIARHARASRVEVGVAYTDGTLHLRIEDDGVGFDPEAAHEGRGLASMERRARAVGGRLTVERTAGGTRLTVRVRMP